MRVQENLLNTPGGFAGCIQRTHARKRKRKADHLRAIERPNNLAADMMCYRAHPRRQRNFLAPDDVLDAHAIFVFRQRRAAANFDLAFSLSVDLAPGPWHRAHEGPSDLSDLSDLTPPNSANSRHFQWQSTSSKPISRSQSTCVCKSRRMFSASSSSRVI